MAPNKMRGPRSTPYSRRRRAKELRETAPPESSSLLWTILLIGLLFCLADVAYILYYVDTQQQQQQQPSVIQAAPQKHASSSVGIGIGVAPTTTVKDDEADESESGGLSKAEYSLMDRQLHQHEMSNEREQNVHQVVNNEPDASLLNNATPQTPLTDDEWRTIQVDKKHILDMLQEAKIPIHELDPQTLRDLPTWAEVTDLYGDEPRIYGLEQCETFQTHSDAAEHFVSTAGTFNSGTNLMAELLIANCHMQPRMDKYGSVNRGVRWQVPWGKVRLRVRYTYCTI
jgi:hypothetical protein